MMAEQYTDTGQLIDSLNTARGRIDRGLELEAWGRALERLIERGWRWVDLDVLRDEVEAFKREVAAHKRGRP
jgi:hypothetical protein